VFENKVLRRIFVPERETLTERELIMRSFIVHTPQQILLE
jgi:hypothetical protein